MLSCSDNREPEHLCGREVHAGELLEAAFLSRHHHVFLFGESKPAALCLGTEKEREPSGVFNGDVFTHHWGSVRENNGTVYSCCSVTSGQYSGCPKRENKGEQ